MPLYKKIKLTTAPRRQRRSVSKFEKTEEWTLMKADLDKGIAPSDVLQVVFTAEDKRKYGIRNRLTVTRFLKKYLAARKLPHVVRSFRRGEEDYIHVIAKGSS